MTFNVLIVEDEIEFRRYLMQSVPWKDYDMQVAGSAADVDTAFEIIQSRPIHILLLDFTLQQSNGLDLARQLQAREPKPRIIAVTGHSEFEMVQQALRLGIDDYLLKPFAKQELLMSILSVRETLVKKDKQDRMNMTIQEAMAEGWLHQLTRTESETESRFLTEQLSRCGIALPRGPRALMCCDLETSETAGNVLSRWRSNAAALWRTAVEKMGGLVWTGFDDLIYTLIGGYEASELAWDLQDLAKEFLSQMSRHLPYSLKIGISGVDPCTPSSTETDSLKPLWKEACQALSKTSGEAPLQVWDENWGTGSGDRHNEAARGALLYWYGIAEKFIDRFHHDSSLDVQTVASHLGISKEYLRQAYRKGSGTNCIQAINHRRLSHARTLLESSPLPVAEIARRAGFRDPSYFARKFKQAFGMSPREFKRQHAPEGRSLS